LFRIDLSVEDVAQQAQQAKEFATSTLDRADSALTTASNLRSKFLVAADNMGDVAGELETNTTTLANTIRDELALVKGGVTGLVDAMVALGDKMAIYVKTTLPNWVQDDLEPTLGDFVTITDSAVRDTLANVKEAYAEILTDGTAIKDELVDTKDDLVRHVNGTAPETGMVFWGGQLARYVNGDLELLAHPFYFAKVTRELMASAVAIFHSTKDGIVGTANDVETLVGTIKGIRDDATKLASDVYDQLGELALAAPPAPDWSEEMTALSDASAKLATRLANAMTNISDGLSTFVTSLVKLPTWLARDLGGA
jgi:hypothetical protein